MLIKYCAIFMQVFSCTRNAANKTLVSYSVLCVMLKINAMHRDHDKLQRQKGHATFDGSCKKKLQKTAGSGEIRTRASEETGALNQRLRPLGHEHRLDFQFLFFLILSLSVEPENSFQHSEEPTKQRVECNLE